MRDLTQQEIDGTPDWAHGYGIVRNHVVFIGEGRAVELVHWYKINKG